LVGSSTHEAKRLAALRSLNLLDTTPEERFDRITRIAAATFNVKFAFITLIDEHRQWFKSAVNFAASETSREDSICHHAINQDTPLIIEDTLLDKKFSSNILVTQEPYVRFYAGAPLKVDNQYNIGTLCILDTKPRTFSSQDQQLLIELTNLAQSELKVADLTATTQQLITSQQQLQEKSAQLAENEKLNALRNQTLELIVNTKPLTTILSSIVKSVEYEYPDMMCSILLVDESGKHLFLKASESLPSFYNEAIDGVEIGDNVGSCGTAAYRGQRIIVDDIATHPYWAPWKALAEQAKLGACWSEPIMSIDNKVLGTFAIYHQQRKVPSKNDFKLIEQSAYLASIAIEREQSHKTIWQQANYDALTHLPNRNMMREHLKMALNHAKRNNKKLGVIFLDVDHFKDVNDTLGHDIGDALLIETAKRLTATVRENDIVARLGGDEFIIILTDLPSTPAIERISQLLLEKLAKPYNLLEEVVHSSASLGITLYPDDAQDIDSLLKNADQAMYGAKALGRNTYQYFTQSMREKAHNRVQLIKDLRVAIEQNQFHLVFQPIINLQTGKVSKAEALIRWQHPEQGLISPLDFIPVAEDTGFIIEISNWVFQQVARRVKSWRKHLCPTLQISINTSPVQYKADDNNICQWISWMTQRHISPEAIAIEITENLLMESQQAVSNKLATFRQAGIAISIDDFGTGYSSFSYLKSFHTDFIKIDKSFVQNMHKDSEDMVLCEAIIVMAKKLKIDVIAEGIETPEQRQLLRSIGCDYGQGYYFAKPLPQEEFEKFLARNNNP